MLRSSPPLTLDRLREVLDYDPSSGIFRWKVRLSKNVPVGRRAGRLGVRGHRYIRIDNGDYQAQRLAWLWCKGEWPAKKLRFVNKDPDDARIENLRYDNGLSGKHDHKSPTGRAAYLRAHRIANSAYYRDLEFRRNFGLSLAEYQAMHDAQKGLCAICEQPENGKRGAALKWLAVDHDHTTKKIRALLCQACNQAIGKMDDSIERLEAAIAYLRRHTPQ